MTCTSTWSWLSKLKKATIDCVLFKKEHGNSWSKEKKTVDRLLGMAGTSTMLSRLGGGASKRKHLNTNVFPDLRMRPLPRNPRGILLNRSLSKVFYKTQRKYHEIRLRIVDEIPRMRTISGFDDYLARMSRGRIILSPHISTDYSLPPLFTICLYYSDLTVGGWISGLWPRGPPSSYGGVWLESAHVSATRMDPGAPASGLLLTGSLLLAALFNARKDDEWHQESRQDRPDQIMHQHLFKVRASIISSFEDNVVRELVPECMEYKKDIYLSYVYFFKDDTHYDALVHRDDLPSLQRSRSLSPVRRRVRDNCEVVVDNIPHSWRSYDLWVAFEECAAVANSRVIYTRHVESHGFGYVEIEYERDVDRAVAIMDGSVWNGRRIQVRRVIENYFDREAAAGI
ncbi:EGF-like domain-containing protein [Tanacetum coccineum]|uniref:EGF-like domain-containing protein n=1 Tax=Tanacetum coccineum TaxID=301880 RepID=A0ABQ5ICN0_9ASTR